MKKGDVVIGKVIDVNFGDRCVVEAETLEKIIVHGGLIGQKVEVQISKKKHDRYEGKIVNILDKGIGEIESKCPHFGKCGGCTY